VNGVMVKCSTLPIACRNTEDIPRFCIKHVPARDPIHYLIQSCSSLTRAGKKCDTKCKFAKPDVNLESIDYTRNNTEFECNHHHTVGKYNITDVCMIPGCIDDVVFSIELKPTDPGYGQSDYDKVPCICVRHRIILGKTGLMPVFDVKTLETIRSEHPEQYREFIRLNNMSVQEFDRLPFTLEEIGCFSIMPTRRAATAVLPATPPVITATSPATPAVSTPATATPATATPATATPATATPATATPATAHLVNRTPIAMSHRLRPEPSGPTTAVPQTAPAVSQTAPAVSQTAPRPTPVLTTPSSSRPPLNPTGGARPPSPLVIPESNTTRVTEPVISDASSHVSPILSSRSTPADQRQVVIESLTDDEDSDRNVDREEMDYHTAVEAMLSLTTALLKFKPGNKRPRSH
jgi:hypothetical protein